MTTKFGKQVHLEDSTQMKLINQMLETSSRQVTEHTKIIIFPQPECLWLPNLAGWGYAMRSSLP